MSFLLPILVVCFFISVVSMMHMKYSLRLWLVLMYITTFILISGSLKIFSFSVSTLFSYSAFALAFYYTITNKQESKFNKSVITILLINVLVYFFLMFLSTDVPISKQLSYHRETFLILQFPFFISVLIHDKKDLFAVFKCICIVCFIMCSYGVYCYVTQSNVYITTVNLLYPTDMAEVFERSITSDRGGLTGRISSTVHDPVFYAGLLVSLICIVFSCFSGLQKNKKKIVFILLILLVINLILTGSRSGMVAIIIGGLYILFCFTNIVTKVKIAFYGIMTYILFLTLNVSSIFGDHQALIESVIFFWDESSSEKIGGSSTSMRIDQFNGTIDLISGNLSFLFGKGYGWIAEYISQNGMHPVLLGFESLVFSGFIQYGIIGFILLYVVLFILLFRLNKKYSLKDKKSYVLANALLFSYSTYALFTGPFYMGFFLGMYILMVKSRCILSREEELVK